VTKHNVLAVLAKCGFTGIDQKLLKKKFPYTPPTQKNKIKRKIIHEFLATCCYIL